MPGFEPEAFLVVAESIVHDGARVSEALLRTAVGRAYYAAHLYAREDLLRRRRINRDRRGKTRHGAVIRALNTPATQLAANALDQLMALRERSDYDLDSMVDHASAEESTRLAHLVILEIRTHPDFRGA